MARLSWRKQPSEQGLASVGQRERGFELRYGDVDVASVTPVTNGMSRQTTGWYYCARADEYGVPRHNTYGTQHWPTKEEAKAECDKWVRARFKVPA